MKSMLVGVLHFFVIFEGSLEYVKQTTIEYIFLELEYVWGKKK